MNGASKIDPQFLKLWRERDELAARLAGIQVWPSPPNEVFFKLSTDTQHEGAD
jgi:hypothetical protein